jgi:glycine oxidase
MKVAIVGNGILGLMLARQLASRGKDQVLLIGAPAREGSATLAAAAMLNSFSELEYDSLGSDLERFKFDVSREAARRWKPIMDAFAPELGEKACGLGTFILNNTTSDELADDNFTAICQFLEEFKEPHQMVDPRTIPNYRPEPRCRAPRAVFIENEGWVNPKRFVGVLEKKLAQNPLIHFISQNATAIRWAGSKVEGVETEDGVVHGADTVVVANGARLTDLLVASNLPIRVQRLFYGVGISLELQSTESIHEKCVRTPNLGLACGVYTVPYSADSMLVGATNFITQNPEHYARASSVSYLVEAAMQQINRDLYRSHLKSVNLGWRPTTTDTFPLVGPTSVKGLFILGGTKRDGFHLSPVLAEVMDSMIHGEAVHPRYTDLRPERSPIRWLSRDAAIEKAVRHYVNAAFQHDYRPTKGRMLEGWKHQLRDDLERLHDAAGAKDWGIPPELLDMYRYGHVKPDVVGAP